MARASQMADIDQYISDSNQTTPGLPPIDTSAPSDAVGAPALEPAQQSGTQEQESAVVPDEEQERASIREMRRAQEEASRQRAEESEIAQNTRRAIETTQDAVATTRELVQQNARKAGNAIGSVPVPGDLLLPLSILLLFFFALIAVNGHTRLMWLWLTLTGNASLTTGAGASFATTPSTSASPGQLTPLSGTATTGLTPLVPLSTSMPVLSSLFTGVEDIL